jgi:hypothetical protein
MTQEFTSTLFRGQTELLTGMGAVKVAGRRFYPTGLQQRKPRGTRRELVGKNKCRNEYPAARDGSRMLQMDSESCSLENHIL